MINKELLDYFNNDELAANVWLSKYALSHEKTPDDMHKRLAKEFARIETNYISSEIINSCSKKLSDKGYRLLQSKGLSEEYIYNTFKDFKYIVPQGSIMSQLGSKTLGSLSNCFVIGQPVDSYGGIFYKEQEMVQLMKRRGGVGIDLSTLRPEGTATTNAAKSSTGAISFMERYSNATREVAQNGRRGALMISMDIKHPDILDFIKIKRDLSKVTGANISIKLNDEFMKAVEKDGDYILHWPCELSNSQKIDLGCSVPQNWNYNETHEFGKAIYKKIKAKEYWDEIIKSAHNVAEPGLMFWDTMVDYSPDGVYPQFKQVTTNPCSEIAMQEYDACRLIAVNLFGFVDDAFTPNAKFNFERFYEINYEAMRLCDDLIDLEIEHIDKILQKLNSDPEELLIKENEVRLWSKIRSTALSSRRTGLGFTALGDVLAALNLKYDSEDAIEIIESIMQVKMRSELDCTIDLGILRGTFKGYDKNLEYTINEDNITYKGNNDFYKFISEEFPVQIDRMISVGRRNLSFSTVAPTGTVSLMTQTTSGVEPLFMPFYTRRKKVNSGDTGVKVDFVDQNRDTWQEFNVLHPNFKDWLQLEFPELDISKRSTIQLQEDFEHSPWFNSTANDIDWIKRVEIQSTIQKYITHSISSTINLPENVTEAEVSDIYLESWKKGLKGITVYRDGSRSGVLVSSDKKENNTFEYKDAVKRPKELDCEIYTTNSKGNKLNVIIGLLDNKPYEVFIADYFTDETKLKLIKKNQGRYDLYKDKEVYSEDITSNITDEQAAITRLVSTSLRHGTDVKFIVEQLTKCDGDMFSFTKSLSRTLKKYIPEGAKSTVKCNDCQSSNVIFEEGCHKCLDCGSSKCG